MRCPFTVPSAGSADVWWLDITSVNVGRAELAELSLEEHKRAAAFAFRADRRRYTAAHVMLRRVLSGYLDIPPSSLLFHREPCPRCGKPTGRPALERRYNLHFSLAHSGDAVLIAVAIVGFFMWDNYKSHTGASAPNPAIVIKKD